MQLKLERKDQVNKTGVAVDSNDEPVAMFTPPIDADYWTYRVIVGEGQAVLGFPKFGTLGIGFAVEKYDWNRNLPATSGVDRVTEWILPNKGDDHIPDEWVRQAVALIIEADKIARPEHHAEVAARKAARS